MLQGHSVMVPHMPRGGGTGSSFKGAANYYLHDKGSDITNERVGGTLTLNLATDNPHAAWRVMAATAMNQQQIKRESGTKATGRKLTQPVFAYSLSWAQDETPSSEHMMEQAQKSLAVLDLSEHQALVVQHTDTKHPHVHILVNRVHPDTGIAAKLSHSQKKLSRYAMAYEKQHGIKCHKRAENELEREKAQTKREYRMRELQQERDMTIRAAQADIQHRANQDEREKRTTHAQEQQQLAKHQRGMAEKIKSWFDYKGVMPQQHREQRQNLTATQRKELDALRAATKAKQEHEKKAITAEYNKRITVLQKVGDTERTALRREAREKEIVQNIQHQRERKEQQRDRGYDLNM